MTVSHALANMSHLHLVVLDSVVHRLFGCPWWLPFGVPFGSVEVLTFNVPLAEIPLCAMCKGKDGWRSTVLA